MAAKPRRVVIARRSARSTFGFALSRLRAVGIITQGRNRSMMKTRNDYVAALDVVASVINATVFAPAFDPHFTPEDCAKVGHSFTLAYRNPVC